MKTVHGLAPDTHRLHLTTFWLLRALPGRFDASRVAANGSRMFYFKQLHTVSSHVTGGPHLISSTGAGGGHPDRRGDRGGGVRCPRAAARDGVRRPAENPHHQTFLPAQVQLLYLLPWLGRTRIRSRSSRAFLLQSEHDITVNLYVYAWPRVCSL